MHARLDYLSSPLAMKVGKHINAAGTALRDSTLPAATQELVKLRASQINGCAFCVDSGARSAKRAGESDERLFAVAAWREAPYFTDAERAALALTEAATRLADRADPGSIRTRKIRDAGRDARHQSSPDLGGW